MVITTTKTSTFYQKEKTTKKVERPKTLCLGKIPTQATPMDCLFKYVSKLRIERVRKI